ncbi:MAG: DNA methyltransferase [Hyphomicrobiaceae bacterium]
MAHLKIPPRIGRVWQSPAIERPAVHFRLHLTPDQLAALKPLIKACCPEGGLMLDPFCGSGSALDAVRQLGRDFIGLRLTNVCTEGEVTEATEKSSVVQTEGRR